MECKQCSTKFTNGKNLKTHIKYCDFIIRSKKENLAAHSVQCKFCYTEFEKETNCWTHIRSKRCRPHIPEAFGNDWKEEKLKFSCRRCDLKFLTESLMLYHFKKVHRNGREYYEDKGKF